MRWSTIGFVCAGIAIATFTSAVLASRRKPDDTIAPAPSSFETMPPVPAPPPPPRHDVLVVTDPMDANVFADGVPLGLAPVKIDTMVPVALRVTRDGYTAFETRLDRSSPERFVVLLEKPRPKPAPSIRPMPAERPRVQCQRPPTCPPEFWDPFDCQCGY